MAINPVLVDSSISKDGLVVLNPRLPEWAWKNRIVGYNSKGILVVDTKVSRSGYYEFPTRFLPVQEFETCSLHSYFSVIGVLAGLGMIGFGIMLFCGMWITHAIWGTGPLFAPFILVPGGILFILGVRRVRLVVSDATGRYVWTSGPFDKNRRTVKEDWAVFIRRCAGCGYDLRGSSGIATCPECGKAIGGRGPTEPMAADVNET